MVARQFDKTEHNTTNSVTEKETKNTALMSLMHFLRQEPTSHKYISSKEINQIAKVTREIWYNVFNPNTNEDARMANYQASRWIFQVFTHSNVYDLRTALTIDSSFPIAEKSYLKSLSSLLPFNRGQRIYRNITSKIPKGEHLVIPIMCNGMPMGAFINDYLSKQSRSLGFALVGFSNGQYSPVPKWYENKVHIADNDIDIIRKNADKQILLVDEYTCTGKTVLAVSEHLKELGVRRINTIINEWAPF